MLLKRAMQQSSCSNFLIDGFPRNKDNHDVWDSLMTDQALVRFLLFVDCSEEEMERRILRRSLNSGRIDDNISSLRKRLVTYREQTLPVVDSFQKSGLVRVIDGTRHSDEVYRDVQSTFLAEFGHSARRDTA